MCKIERIDPYTVSMFSLLNGPNLRRRIFGTFLHLAIMGNVSSGLDNDLGMMEEYLTRSRLTTYQFRPNCVSMQPRMLLKGPILRS